MGKRQQMCEFQQGNSRKRQKREHFKSEAITNHKKTPPKILKSPKVLKTEKIHKLKTVPTVVYKEYDSSTDMYPDKKDLKSNFNDLPKVKDLHTDESEDTDSLSVITTATCPPVASSRLLSIGTHDCPICKEPRELKGDHASVSLRCGHLFGQKCLLNWFTMLEQRCPQCNGFAVFHDIRPVQCDSLSAIDLTDERLGALAVGADGVFNSSGNITTNSESQWLAARKELLQNIDNADVTRIEVVDEKKKFEKNLLFGLTCYSLFVNVVFFVLWLTMD